MSKNETDMNRQKASKALVYSYQFLLIFGIFIITNLCNIVISLVYFANIRKIP